MSDKRRRRRQNSEDSEGSEGEVKIDKQGGDDLDLEKDEGVVRNIFLYFLLNPVPALRTIRTWTSFIIATPPIVLAFNTINLKIPSMAFYKYQTLEMR